LEYTVSTIETEVIVEIQYCNNYLGSHYCNNVPNNYLGSHAVVLSCFVTELQKPSSLGLEPRNYPD
jgi:hypothetical protein